MPPRKRQRRGADEKAPRNSTEAAEPSAASPDNDETGEPEEFLEPEVQAVSADDLLAEEDEEALDEEGTAASRSLVPAGPSELARVDPLTRYIQEVSRYPELSREEEAVLARRYRDTGDPEAALRLITANLRLVLKIALMFRRAIRNMLDLIQEGNVGLVEALRRYDPDEKTRFSTYAAWWIKAYILKFLLDNRRLVRVGTTNARRKLIYNLRREQRALEAQGIRPTPRLLAERFGVSQEDVIDVQKALDGGDLPIDAPVREGGRESFADFLPADADVEGSFVDREMREALARNIAAFREGLGERDRAILDRRLLADEPATLQDLGDDFGVTREAIRQSESRLTERLRAHLEGTLGEEGIRHFTEGERRPRRGTGA